MRALGAIVLLLSSFIFFNQLNPELLKVRFKPIDANQEPVNFDGVIDNAFDDDTFTKWDTRTLEEKNLTAGRNRVCWEDSFFSFVSEDNISDCDNLQKIHKEKNTLINGKLKYNYFKCNFEDSEGFLDWGDDACFYTQLPALSKYIEDNNKTGYEFKRLPSNNINILWRNEGAW